MPDLKDQLGVRLTLRKVDPIGDDPFLRELYLSTRDDLEALPSDEMRQMIGQMQYDVHQTSYASEYARADHLIVLLDGNPIGRYFIERRADAIVCPDLSILPEYRSHGIGSYILSSFFAEAESGGIPFRFHVLKTNRALRLYLRIGCVITGDDGSHYSMEWQPKRNSAAREDNH